VTRCSIVIISKDERGLDTTLDALRKLGPGADAEVVVVDASQQRLSEIRDLHPEVTWIDYRRPPGKRITIPEQRNVGVRAARSDVIVFTDAGCEPESGWLAALLEPVLDGAEEMVSGRTLSVRGSIYDAAILAQQGYLRECPTINVAFTRDLYERLGGFDERFDYGSDVDFSWRVNDSGSRILHVPDAVVRADWGDARRQLRRSYRYGRARARLYAKHRRRLPELVRTDVTAVAYPLFLLGLPLSALWPAYILLLLVPLAHNRRNRPVATVADHLAYAVGVLAELAASARAAAHR